MYICLTNRYLISLLHAYVSSTICFVFFKTLELWIFNDYDIDNSG